MATKQPAVSNEEQTAESAEELSTRINDNGVSADLPEGAVQMSRQDVEAVWVDPREVQIFKNAGYQLIEGV